jgi:HEAT repeat protein
MSLLLALLLLAQDSDLDALERRFEQEKKLTADERKPTVMAIARLRTEEAAGFLSDVFDRDADEALRRFTLQGLAVCGTPNAMKKLLAVAKRSDADDQDRAWALDSAVWKGSEEAAVLAATILQNRGESGWLRSQAGSTLLKYRPLEKSEKAWRSVLEDKSDEVRARALEALAPLKDPKVLTLARTALVDPAQPDEVRRAAVEPWRVKGGAAAVRLFLDIPIAGEGGLRAALAAALAKMTDDEAFEALVAGLSRASAEHRAVAAHALGKSPREESLTVLKGLLIDRNSDVRFAAIHAIASRGTDEAAAIVKAAARRSEDDFAAAAVGLLTEFPSAETADLLIQLAGKSTRAAYRTAVIDALARIDAPGAFGVFEKGLQAREWPIRAASIRGLVRMRRIESIDLLVERTAKEEGRLLADLVGALKKLTGKNLGYNPAHWDAWWRINREKFSFDSVVDEAGGGAAGVTTYHDVPVISRKIIFLVDVSGSMRYSQKGTTRLEGAKAELTKVLRALAKEVRVNLIFFSDEAEAWKGRLVPVGPNLKQALAAVEALESEGQTNIYDALEKAFADPDVDTVYLLSDGDPSVGKYTREAEILREVRRMNQARQIIIHTIGLTSSSFLKKLAAENWGQYEVKK